MKISAVEAIALDVPITVRHRPDPFVRHCNLLRIETDAGITGYGFTAPGEWHRTVADIVNDTVAGSLVGRDPRNISEIVSALSGRFNRTKGTGIWSSVLSMIDIGLWDLQGKIYGVSTTSLLGGARKAVPAYITFGLAEYTVDELVETVGFLADQGHRRFKMIVGGLRSRPKGKDEGTRAGESHWFQAFAEDLLLEDIRRVAAVRKAIGPDIGLMVDGNCGLSFGEAKRLAQGLEEFNLMWFEEPISGNDPRLLADLRQQTSVPISAGQHLGNLAAHRTMMEAGAYDICQLNVVHCGGYSEAVKIAHLAEANNLPIATGAAQPYHNMHLHAGLPNGGLVEFHWLSWKVGETIFVDPPAPKDGWAAVPDAPGLGLEVNEKAVAEHRV